MERDHAAFHTCHRLSHGSSHERGAHHGPAVASVHGLVTHGLVTHGLVSVGLRDEEAYLGGRAPRSILFAW
ncbi:hypothetical protein D3M95_02855 [Corynebacterium falsenii]|uniref:Uncharacterized protein n=1 Tax=Corynebacterium falsenii TaxID=108486 RepID=A0A418Q932_9CORY|nr:hypothetical protein D3M95_02855 [Corynebacterium falsenii]